ncbi:MFS general substrate transporter [Gymnopilus junonius]|uniref:MFS general substrate transporter n=1 Tax=Gymnopilus junonius TaxID=109634 RepID=A0A9P5TLT9_GYMJU|nr:MFS general substrate transporter [Gymnopilus junonius]
MSSDPTLLKGYDEKIEQASDVEESSQSQLPESFAGTEEEKNLVRKLDLRIFPITCLLYLFASLDRSNLGNARLQGLPEDALGGDPTGVRFDWVTSAFFFSYATGFNFASLMTARVAIGVFEALLGPVMTLYMSLFYTRQELGLRLASWFSFATVAGAFGGLIAFGVQHIQSSVHNWRLLFIIEGVPPVILGVITYYFLPDRPESTPFLNEREQRIAMERMNRTMTADVGVVIQKGKSHIRAAFLDWRVYIAGVIYFGLNTALAAIGAFLPTIIASFGFNFKVEVSSWVFRVQSEALATCKSFFFKANHKTKCLFRLLVVVPTNIHVRYFATFCITTGTYTTIGLTIAWFGHNLGSETKKATGLPIFMAIGQGGSILGSHLFPKTEAPRYIKGFSAALCSVILSISYRWDNARRDRLYGKPKPGTKIDTRELADYAPEYRYVP